MGNGIAIITFNQETSQFAIAKEWKFPKQDLNYSYYNQKDNFVYLSAENPKTTLFDIFVYDMEVIQDKLFIANMQGTVTIYSLPVITKIGAMLHKNTVNSIVSSEYVTKTNIKIPQMFVLESKYN